MDQDEADVEPDVEPDAEVAAEVEEVDAEVDAEGPLLYEAFSSAGVEETLHTHLLPTIPPHVVRMMYDFLYTMNSCRFCYTPVPAILREMRDHSQNEHPEELRRELVKDIQRRRNEARSAENEEVFEVEMMEW